MHTIAIDATDETSLATMVGVGVPSSCSERFASLRLASCFIRRYGERRYPQIKAIQALEERNSIT